MDIVLIQNKYVFFLERWPSLDMCFQIIVSCPELCPSHIKAEAESLPEVCQPCASAWDLPWRVPARRSSGGSWVASRPPPPCSVWPPGTLEILSPVPSELQPNLAPLCPQSTLQLQLSVFCSHCSASWAAGERLSFTPADRSVSETTSSETVCHTLLTRSKDSEI